MGGSKESEVKKAEEARADKATRIREDIDLKKRGGRKGD